METKSMLISLVDAKKFYPDGSLEFKVMCETTFPETFKKDIIDRVKTFQNALSIYLQTNELSEIERIILDYSGNSTKVIVSKANLQLFIICEVLNQGWAPDWANTSQRKWYPWFYMSPFAFVDAPYHYGASATGCASRLRLKSEELARYAGKTFVDIYEISYSK